MDISQELTLISLFSGCGGLDLGFKKVGFKTIWANEYDDTIWPTFEKNFPTIHIDARSITDILSSGIPKSIGIIGGPPCQSWSEAGACRGINDHRGRLFFEYIRVLNDKKPLFFLAENVSGILANIHAEAFQNILSQFSVAGYNISYKLLNAKYFNVPQDRERVIIVGYQKKMGKKFSFPESNFKLVTLRDAISGLPEAMAAQQYNKTNGDSLVVPNHEYMTGGFSSIYMSRNRVRSWDEQSFTIQAGGRHAPIHPRAPKMKFINKNKREFVKGKERLYRRLSIRECARVQTFPDDFIFKYTDLSDGYKMVGNAVPVEMAHYIGLSIKKDILGFLSNGVSRKRIAQQDYALVGET